VFSIAALFSTAGPALGAFDHLFPSESDELSESHLASQRQFTVMFGTRPSKRFDSISYGSGMRMNRRDVRAGKIDTVVVYKVDRLTRSLADFAKLVELFDQYGVSFVSITQSFNTTTCRSRLTLNVRGIDISTCGL
jgi:Resolvase, N terminal domain